LRLPTELHTALVAWARREQRSLHAQILWILQHAAADDRIEAAKEHL
jgi:hypothetical protein